jgi:hypothetical protein
MANGAAFGRRAEGFATPRKGAERVPFSWKAFLAMPPLVVSSQLLVAAAGFELIGYGVVRALAAVSGTSLMEKIFDVWIEGLWMFGLPVALITEVQRLLLNRLGIESVRGYAVCGALVMMIAVFLDSIWSNLDTHSPIQLLSAAGFAFCSLPMGVAQGALYRAIAGTVPGR